MISIIVPVFNAEKYLERCIVSVKNQTFKDYEVWLIDDGSTDDSALMCDKYAKEYPWISTIHCENGGAGAASEKGIMKCQGEYVCFIDADDYVNDRFLECLYSDIESENADIACCRILQINGDMEIVTDSYNKREVVCTKDIFVKDYLEKKSLYNKVVTAKIFRKDAIKDVHFSSIRYGEDTLFMYEAFYKARKIVLNPYIGYCYFRNDGSLTISAQKEGKEVLVSLDHIRAAKALQILGEGCSKDYKDKANAEYAKAVFAAVSRMVKYNNKALYKEKESYICEHLESSIRLEGISKKIEMFLMAYRMSPAIFWAEYSLLLKVKKLLCKKGQ